MAAGGCWGFVGDGTLEGLEACRECFLLLGVVLCFVAAGGCWGFVGDGILGGLEACREGFFSSWALLSGTPKACT